MPRPLLPLALASLLLGSTAHADDEILTLYGGVLSSHGADVAVGDFDGDGVDDLVVAAPSDETFNPWGGAVYVWSGATGNLLHHWGPWGPTGYACAVGAVADLNGDGKDEFIVGDWLDDNGGNNAGRVYVHSGADASILATIDGPVVDGVFGRDLVGLNDTNGDGVADFAVGAPNQLGGVLYVHSGADFSLLWQQNGTIGDFFSNIGSVVENAGDVNNDGVDDVVVGMGNEGTAFDFAGRVKVYSGADGSVLHEFFGTQENHYAGRAVGSAGDLDGDGHDDVLVTFQGDTTEGTLAGAVRVFSGATGAVLWEQFGWADDTLGLQALGIGDQDGDSVPDIAMSCSRSDLGAYLAGYVRVHSGATGRLLGLWLAEEPYNGSSDGYGRTLEVVGDLNGDGRPELVIGYPGDNGVNPGSDYGSARVRSSVPLGAPSCLGAALPCPCGNVSADAGCLNSRGRGAFLAGGGSASLTDDDLRLAAIDLPKGKSCVGFVGNLSTPSPFGAGVLCAGSPNQRLPVRNSSDSGVVVYDGGIVSSLGLGGQTSSTFQVWFRDPGGPCGAEFSVTSALTITWTP